MLKKFVQSLHMGRVVRDAVLILQGEYKISVGLRSAELEQVQRIVSCHGSLGIRPHDVAASFACEHLAQLSDSDPKKPALASFYSLVAASHHAAGRVTDANLNGLKNEELRLIGKRFDVSDGRKREIEKKALEKLERYRRGEDVGNIDITPSWAFSDDDDDFLNSASSQHPDPTPSSTAIGRNDPCPCASGKKYKECHGQLESMASKSLKDTDSLTPRELKALRMRELNPNYRAPLEDMGPARDDRDPISIMGEALEQPKAGSDKAEKTWLLGGRGRDPVHIERFSSPIGMGELTLPTPEGSATTNGCHDCTDQDENDEDNEEWGVEFVDLVRRIAGEELDIATRAEYTPSCIEPELIVQYEEIFGKDLFAMVERVTKQERRKRLSSPLADSQSDVVTEEDAEIFGSEIIDALRLKSKIFCLD